ncbi:MAG: TonB-dependent siderophore receptor [Methylotenera sp.]|nr:TonB-dependent siderophore receptor [Methylotenera sp.]
MIRKLTLSTLLLCGSGVVMAEETNASSVEFNEVANLPVMTINAIKDAPVYSSPSNTAATRFEAESLAVPQSTQTINRAVIDDVGAVDVRDVLKQVPSAFAGHTRLAPFASFSWKVRGFDAAVTRNGFRQIYFEDVDQSALSNIDRVEIIKGPGGAVYGKEGLGGTVHMVTKRPEKEFKGSAYVSAGQYDTRVGGFDLTGGLGDSGIGLRLNGEIERSGTFVKHQDIDRDNLSLTATWDKGGPVRAFLLAEYQRRETLPNPGLPVVGTALSNGVAKANRKTYLGEPNVDYLDTWSPLIQAWLEFDVAENWTLSPRYQHFEFNVNQQQMRLRGPESLDPSLTKRNGRFNFRERDKTDTVQLELKGKFELGSSSHQILFGGEVNNHQYAGNWFNYVAVPSISVLNPIYLSVPPAVGATRQAFSGTIDTEETYVQDLIGIGDKFDVLAGLRHSRVAIDSEFNGVLTPGQNDNLTSYQVGAAYRFIPDWSIFAGVGTGLSVDNIVGSISATGATFKPEKSKQHEIGIKHQSGSLSGSLSLFNISMENVATADPNDPDFEVQTGEQRSRGVEFEAGWQASQDLYISGGAAYIDAEVTKSNNGDVGNRLGNVAHVQVNMWGNYKITPAINIGVGANYVGKRYGTISNTYELPSYTTVDASLAWRIDQKSKAELFVKNIFDKTYYTGNNDFAVYPGEPVTAYARLTVDF